MTQKLTTDHLISTPSNDTHAFFPLSTPLILNNLNGFRARPMLNSLASAEALRVSKRAARDVFEMWVTRRKTYTEWAGAVWTVPVVGTAS